MFGLTHYLPFAVSVPRIIIKWVLKTRTEAYPIAAPTSLRGVPNNDDIISNEPKKPP